MKIKALHIEDFKGLANVEITKFDSNLNLLIGINGSGKSSVLDAIALLLSSFTARLTTSSSKGNVIPVESVRRDSRRGCLLKLTLDNDVSWSKFKTKKMDKKDESDYSELNEFTSKMRHQLDEGQQICVPIIVHYGVRRSVTEIPLKFPNADTSLPTATYKDWLDSKASYRDIFPWIRAEEDYENEMRVENSNARDRGLEALRDAMRRVFPEYTDLKVRRKPHQEVVLKKNGEELPLSQLSDGEKCYIALVCDIVRRLSLANPSGEILDGEGVVLIDEVDLHLHPSWEQTVMEKLHTTFKNIQFIVSAHSPLVASHFNGQIFAVSNGTVTLLPRLFGLDYSTILQDWMSTTPSNKKINSMLELYYAYKENNMEEQAKQVWQKIVAAFDGDTRAPFIQKIK